MGPIRGALSGLAQNRTYRCHELPASKHPLTLILAQAANVVVGSMVQKQTSRLNDELAAAANAAGKVTGEGGGGGRVPTNGRRSLIHRRKSTCNLNLYGSERGGGGGPDPLDAAPHRLYLLYYLLSAGGGGSDWTDCDQHGCGGVTGESIMRSS